MTGNPNHDARGRFAKGVGAVKNAAKAVYRKAKQVAPHLAAGASAVAGAYLLTKGLQNQEMERARERGRLRGHALGTIGGARDLSEHKKSLQSHISHQHEKSDGQMMHNYPRGRGRHPGGRTSPTIKTVTWRKPSEGRHPSFR